MKTSKRLFLLPLLGTLVPCVAWAEGSTRQPIPGAVPGANPPQNEVYFGTGNNGVNRVIRTNNGYTGVSVTLDGLSFRMPTNQAGLYQVANAAGVPVLNGDGTGSIDLAIQPFPRNPTAKGNKPSAYIGGLFPPVNAIGNLMDSLDPTLPRRTQVDGGLQYEPTHLFGAAPGWSIFLYARPINIEIRRVDPQGNFVLDGRGNQILDRHGIIEMNPRELDPRNTNSPNGRAWRNFSNPIQGTMHLEATPVEP